MILEVTWGIEPGYAGNTRPQRLRIDTADYFDNDDEYLSLTPFEKLDFIESCVEEDFNNKIKFYIESVDET